MPFITNNPAVRVFRFINVYFGQYRGAIIIVAVLTFVSSLLEGIGINAVIPLFSFVSGGGGETADVISQTTRHLFSFIHVPYTFRYLFLMIGLLFVVKTVVLFVSQYITLITQVTYERDVRNEITRLTFDSDWPYLSTQKLGHLEQMLIMSVEQGSKFLIRISSFVLIAANLIVYSLLAINISVGITTLTLLFGLVLFYSFKPLFKRGGIAAEAMLKEYKKLAHYINENIIGLKAVKASFVEAQVLHKASGYFEELRTLRRRVGLIAALSSAIIQPLPLFFIMGIFAFFYKTSMFSFASFAVVIYAINRVFANFQNVQSEVNTLVTLIPHLASAQRYRNECALHKEEDHGTRQFSFADRLEFKQVTFGYESGREVFSNISFTLTKGEMLGLIGPSGAGKTTLVDLFLRLLRPQRGTILLDGVDISEISLKNWRTNVGYVSQDIFLFNDTIANNIKFYGDSIGDDDIVEAAKLANIYDFIMQQPDTFKTVVGERGIKLSGGQRQRIALARVLARRPQILILDEATSALDAESEILVQKAIEGLHGKITVVAIAHRLSTIINSDRLIVLENGAIVEEGTPKKLLADENSYFSKVYNLKR